jgi:outer membrane protein OmpA-like peptidoglycan-associated protein
MRSGFSIIITLLVCIALLTAGCSTSPHTEQKKADKTYIDVYGHTDSIGSHKYNYKLSNRRAHCVAEYIIAQGCNVHRFSIQGFGETRPIASNTDKSGRAQNRRVEIEISPLT